MKKNAFTLAEVLITLVIIGVIAAMTIPTLMGNTNEQELKTQAKKSISAINQAIKLDEALYGNNPVQFQEVGDNAQNIENLEKFKQSLMNHLSVINNDFSYCGDPSICAGFITADGLQIEVSRGWPAPAIGVYFKNGSRLLPLHYDYWGGGKTYVADTGMFGEEECRQIICNLD